MARRQLQPLVVIRFAETAALEGVYDKSVKKKLLAAWEGTGIHPLLKDLGFRPLFRSVKVEKLKALEESAIARGYPENRLFHYFQVDVPLDLDLGTVEQELRNLIQDGKAESLLLEYVRVHREVPPLPAKEGGKGIAHLAPAPEGVGVDAVAWKPGGKGQGQVVADVEYGWWTGHSDLEGSATGASPKTFEKVAGSIGTAAAFHGTRVLGTLAARADGKYGLGVAPELSKVWLSSVARKGSVPIYSVADAIVAATAVLAPHHILLVEQQTLLDNKALVNPSETAAGAKAYGPVEYDDEARDAILLATKIGITVVEAAGNGVTNAGFAEHVDLDELSSWGDDSGAILVGAADYVGGEHVPIACGCRGGRIGCFAWGSGVYASTPLGTKGSYKSSVTSGFGGTSAAAAIVAGVAAIVQGLLQAAGRNRLSPGEMRALLYDSSLGTESADPPRDKIGVMPDLAKIAAKLGLWGGATPRGGEPAPG